MCVWLFTLKNKSTTNSLIAVPQLPGQVGCFSSSTSSPSVSTAVAGPKLTRRKVPSSIPKSHAIIVSQVMVPRNNKTFSCAGDTEICCSRIWVRVIHRGCRMCASSWDLEWMYCSRGTWKVVALVVWEGMNVSRYSDSNVK